MNKYETIHNVKFVLNHNLFKKMPHVRDLLKLTINNYTNMLFFPNYGSNNELNNNLNSIQYYINKYDIQIPELDSIVNNIRMDVYTTQVSNIVNMSNLMNTMNPGTAPAP